MRVWQIGDGFGLENLACVEREELSAGPGQVVIAMRAVSLNFRDYMMVQGFYNPRQRLPLVPCSDGVGEVIAVGEGVSRVVPGDRVMPIFAQAWICGRPSRDKLKTTLGGPLDGTLGERMVVDQESLVIVPAHLSDEEAACLPCVGVTAWNALVCEGRVAAGDRVLILGTGGVAIFATQLAGVLGAEVFVTSSSDAKLERVKALGAAHGVNYRTTPAWGKAIKALTGGEGVDHVVELGGAGTLEESLRAVRIGGQISLIGALSGAAQELNVLPILMQHVRVQGIIVGSREMFEALNRAVSLHALRPVVDRVFEFEEAREAFEYLASGEHFGKVCVRIA
ncbi:MAG: NAD(P)-dependent alcohol dehydrogenase [Bradymonadaceae bacterium]|nr:NAD(P)-dependent alcohol dehydrogenase [Lujinxingiaceae bacterium]